MLPHRNALRLGRLAPLHRLDGLAALLVACTPAAEFAVRSAKEAAAAYRAAYKADLLGPGSHRVDPNMPDLHRAAYAIVDEDHDRAVARRTLALMEKL